MGQSFRFHPTFLILLLALLTSRETIHAQTQAGHGRIVVGKDGYDLVYEDGHPFFWLGDTGWELFHRLTYPEITQYLDNRSAKGFTVIQAVALAEFDGLNTPNAYGQKPLRGPDPTQPNEDYFRLIDSVFVLARQRNLVIGLLPTWGSNVTQAWSEGPVIFDSTNAYAYGKWIGKRYKNQQNIIWILGGDRPALTREKDWRPVWRAMAKGIIESTEGHCLITYHPSGGSNSSSQWIHQEAWLNLNMFQSGHGDGHDTPCWEYVRRDRSYKPHKPTLDAEPNYEDHPVNPWPKWNTDSGYFRAYDVRKQLYRSVFAGACGVTYGHHAVWQFMSAKEVAINYPDRGWINAIDRPGAFQAGYLRRLIESRPMLNRQPDSTLITEAPGEKGNHIQAFRGGDNSYCMIYLPVGRSITLNTSFLKHDQVNAWWFNPREGKSVKIGTLKKEKTMLFESPDTGREHDWVLVIDDASFTYAQPG